MAILSERCADFGSCCCHYMGACMKKMCYGLSLQWCPYSFGKTVCATGCVQLLHSGALADRRAILLRQVAVIPFWPFIAIFLVIGGGITVLIGVGEVASTTSGTTTEDDLIKLNNNVMVAAYCAIGYLALVNLLVGCRPDGDAPPLPCASLCASHMDMDMDMDMDMGSGGPSTLLVLRCSGDLLGLRQQAADPQHQLPQGRVLGLHGDGGHMQGQGERRHTPSPRWSPALASVRQPRHRRSSTTAAAL